MAEAVTKGEAWLNQHAQKMEAETDTGLKFKDNFLEFLILEVTGNWQVPDCASIEPML
jgi:hypothetical protein